MTSKPYQIFSSQVEQSIVNLICFYEVFGHINARDVKESWIQLLLCLDIFDYRGRPLCRFWADDAGFDDNYLRQFYHDGQIRCCHYLDTSLDTKHNESLSSAFRQFYIDASDPLIERQGDSALLDAITTFAAFACCVEHKGSKKRMGTLAQELLPIVKKWRRQYVFCEPLEPALIVEMVDTDPPGRVSGIFTRRLKKQSKKQQRSRSVSPSSDEETFDVSLRPERTLRPVSSAHDLLMVPRRGASNASNWSVTERGRSRKAHFASFLKSTGFGAGSSTNAKRNTWTVGRPLSTIQAEGSHDSVSHRKSISARID